MICPYCKFPLQVGLVPMSGTEWPHGSKRVRCGTCQAQFSVELTVIRVPSLEWRSKPRINDSGPAHTYCPRCGSSMGLAENECPQCGA